MIDNREAATEYLARRLPITLCKPATKKPMGRAWQNRIWTEAEVDGAFEEHGVCNVGTVLGKRSGIIAIECDAPEAERTFAELFADCEPVVTPTFQSRRGKYRLFTSPPELQAVDSAVINISKLQVLTGGKDKAWQCLLPPSTTDNFERRWLVDLDECNPAPLPQPAINRILAAHRSAKSSKSSKASKSSSSLSSSKASSTKSDKSSCSTGAGLENWYKSTSRESRNTEYSDTSDVYQRQNGSLTIEKAITSTLPAEFGQRHRQVFELCRCLKAVPECVTATADSLRPIVLEWHSRALPRITTKAFDETWADFLDSFPKVQFPAGGEPMTQIYQQSLLQPLPAVAERYQAESLKRLVGLCAELQRIAGDGQPFYLACRAAGKRLGIDHKLANKFLRLLVHDKVLVEVEKGVRRRASTFRYIGDDVTNPPADMAQMETAAA